MRRRVDVRLERQVLLTQRFDRVDVASDDGAASTGSDALGGVDATVDSCSSPPPLAVSLPTRYGSSRTSRTTITTPPIIPPVRRSPNHARKDKGRFFELFSAAWIVVDRAGDETRSPWLAREGTGDPSGSCE
jgi:hypothetical protein